VGDLARAIVRGESSRGARAVRAAGQKWSEVVGPEIAAHTSVLGLERRALRVGVDSSALLAELAGFYRAGLLEALQSGERPLAVTDVRFELDGGTSRIEELRR
jgi:predicted nucleic acid-binding Zn ribbon protein